MEYPSILFDHLQPSTIEQERHSSGFLQDIHMDKIIQDIVKGKEEYGLEPLFYRKLESIESIRYRIAIMKEIDRSVSVHSIEAFSRSMLKVREFAHYSRSFADRDQRMKWLLDAAHLYCEAVMELHHTLEAVELQSKGLKRFQEWLTHYIHTSYFSALFKATCELQHAFSGIRFSMALAGGKLK